VIILAVLILTTASDKAGPKRPCLNGTLSINTVGTHVTPNGVRWKITRAQKTYACPNPPPKTIM